MCGVAGFWHVGADYCLEAIGRNMASKISSRGPDDCGVFEYSDEGLCLAHRRLSIIDLSSAGRQPMTSPCGRYVLVYNGEIYNHGTIRRELDAVKEGWGWQGHSDTETLLAALSFWGMSKTLDRLNGMFAFALWDAVEKTLFLARDRMGEKPLYYGHSGECFLFGSELKALTTHPYWQGEVNRDALALYLRHSHVPSPYSIYQRIFKLPPAHFVAIRDGGRLVDEPQCYWNLAEVALAGAANAATGEASAEALMVEFDALLRDAVGCRMVADVSLGAFLSGGYDSTMVVAQMQAQSDRPVKTFSIGFHDNVFNEADHAKAVAGHLGTDHTELYVTPDEALEVIQDLPTIYDEPFSDSSQIPTFLVSRIAKKDVTVSLSGDGGDELFGGYNRHVIGPKVWRSASRLPDSVRKVAGRLVAHVAQRNVQGVLQTLPAKWRIPNITNKLEKLADAMKASDGVDFYRTLVSHWKDPASVVIGAREPETNLTRVETLPELPGLCEQMMYLDQVTYLPDGILTKVDRASMAVSLEGRVPFLDHRLVEFAWRVPTEFKVRNGRGKWLLREVLNQYVPRELMERPKKGFGIPLEQWLCGPLREWAEELLSEERLRREGFFYPLPVRKMWEDFLAGKGRFQYQLWDVLMFQAWLEANPAAH